MQSSALSAIIRNTTSLCSRILILEVFEHSDSVSLEGGAFSFSRVSVASFSFTMYEKLLCEFVELVDCSQWAY